jgi:hypothetical protein
MVGRVSGREIKWLRGNRQAFSPVQVTRRITGYQGASMNGKHRTSCCTGMTARGAVMTLPIAADVQCEALFASSLQSTDTVTADVATAEITRTIQRLGPTGCASRMAQEFGDHPEEARDRMRWARQLTSQLSPVLSGPAVGPSRCAA